jgi:uncharacterized membrane protein
METVNISPTKAFSNVYDKVNQSLGTSMDAKSIMIFLIVLVVFSLLFSNLGGSNSDLSPNSSNSGINILEVILWSMFLFLLLANGLQYFFGIEAKASVKNLLSGDTPEVGIELSDTSKSLLKRTLPEINKEKKSKSQQGQEDKDKKEVFYIKDNVYTYEQAKAVCKAHDAELADYNQVEKTYQEGGEWCGYGWSKNQQILFPTQKSTWNELQEIEGHENDCGRPGVNGGYIENSKAKFGVNCYGVKRSPNEFEEAILKEMKKKQYPLSQKDKEFNKNVNKYKQLMKDGKMTINPFNMEKWKW